MFIGLILLAIGVIALLVQTGVLTGSIWSYAWPVILIIIGLLFIWGRGRRGWGCCGPWHSHGEEDKKQ